MKTRTWTAAFRKAFATGVVTTGMIAMFALSTGTALAQDGPPPPPPGGFGGQQGGPPMGGMMMGGPRMGLPHSMQLVNRPDVSRDLGLTQDQHDQIRDVFDRVTEKMGLPPGGPGGPGGFGGPPPGGGQGGFGGPPGGGQGGFGGPPPGGPGGPGRPGPTSPELRAKMDKMQAAIDSAIDKVLTSAQVARLKEIKIQLAGASAVLDKGIQSQIGINDDQKAQIEKIAEAQRQKMGPPQGGFAFGGPGGQGGPPPGGPGGQGGFGGPPGGGDGGPGGPPPGFGPGGPGGPGGDRMEKAHKELNDAIEAILTSDQKAALKKMAGTKVFVDDKRPPRRPGGQGGPGGFGGPPPGGGDN